LSVAFLINSGAQKYEVETQSQQLSTKKLCRW